jgi:uncharacterized protein (DUF342 family)
MKIYTGKNITVTNGRVIIDGKDITPDEKEIRIEIAGDVENLKIDACTSVTVKGNVNGSIQIMSGDIAVEGNCKGDIECTSGQVVVQGNVEGNIETTAGDITANNISGDVSTMAGDIKYRK